jgi:hypothetical protein
LLLILFAGMADALGVCATRPARRQPDLVAVADGVTDGVAPGTFLPSARRAAVQPRAPELALKLNNPFSSSGKQSGDTEVPPLEQTPGRKVALLVEPTPFTHVSGYSNRFKEMLRFLKEGGDEPEVITPDDTPERPNSFLGMPITYVPGFRLFLYKQVQLTCDLGLRAWRRLRERRPNLIHAVMPGIFALPAIVYARLLKIPLVISYHTHLPYYAGRYVKIPGLREFCVKAAEWFLPLSLNWADLTLTTSPQLKGQLEELGEQAWHACAVAPAAPLKAPRRAPSRAIPFRHPSPLGVRPPSRHTMPSSTTVSPAHGVAPTVLPQVAPTSTCGARASTRTYSIRRSTCRTRKCAQP